MTNLKIQNYLILTTVKTTEDEWEKVLNFLALKKRMDSKTLMMNTAGNKSFQKVRGIMSKMEDEQLPYTGISILSGQSIMNRDELYSCLDIGLSFRNKDNGVLMVSDVPLEALLMSIQTHFEFVDHDLDLDNDEYLAQYVIELRKSPNLLIYDARSGRFGY